MTNLVHNALHTGNLNSARYANSQCLMWTPQLHVHIMQQNAPWFVAFEPTPGSDATPLVNQTTLNFSPNSYATPQMNDASTKTNWI